MPRFVILYHEIQAESHQLGDRKSHWDFMLEYDGKLRTWELPQQPFSGVECDAIMLADHRLDYLSYEGPVSGDRGTVTRYDAGAYERIKWSEREVVVRLNGEHIVGVATLKRHVKTPWRFRITGSSQFAKDA